MEISYSASIQRSGPCLKGGEHQVAAKLRGLTACLLLCTGLPFSQAGRLSASTPNDFRRIISLVKQGKLPEAEKGLKEALKNDPNCPMAYELLGIIYRHEAKFTMAEEALGKAVRLSNGKDPKLLFLLCQTEFALKKRREALQLASQVSALAKTDPIAHYSLGQLLLANGSLVDGVLELEEAHALAPNNPAITTELIIGYLDERDHALAENLLAAFLKRASYDDLVQAGSRFGDTGHFGAAERAFYLALQIRPGAYDAGFNLAFSTYRQGNLQAALATLAKLAPQAVEDQWDYHYLRGKIELALHHDQMAVTDLLKAFSLRPDNQSLCSDTGLILFRFENYWKALKVYQTCASVLPDSVAIETGLGLTYFRLGKYEDAITTFRKVLAIEPGADAAREALAFLLYIEGNLNEASRVLQARMEEKGVDFYVYYLDALVLLRLRPMGDHDDAVHALDEALRRNPHFAPAYFEKARVWAGRGNRAGALADLRLAIQADPAYAQPYYVQAQIDYKLGDKEAAEQARLRFMALNHEREEKEQEHQVESQLVQALR